MARGWRLDLQPVLLVQRVQILLARARARAPARWFLHEAVRALGHVERPALLRILERRNAALVVVPEK
eukprot:COSAG02_NODE_8934_length_2394_cov_4.862816_1_plen_67_part_10